MSSPRVVELERQLAIIERAVDAAAGDRMSEVWIAMSISSHNRPSHDQWRDWLKQSGLVCDELKLWFHRLPQDLALISTPNFGGTLGDDWVLVETPNRITAGEMLYSWYSVKLNQQYRHWGKQRH